MWCICLPQGVLIRHEGVVNVVHTVTKLWEITEADSIFQLSSLSFDVCLLDCYSAICSGARLHLWHGDWKDALLSSKSTIMSTTPTVLEMLHPEELETLRVLVPGGEALSLNTARKWCDSHDLYNAYGPTECSIEVSEGFIQGHNTHIDIGAPHPRCVCVVGSQDLQSVAVGQTGELFLGGVCVADGYLNRPTLTHERFIQSPWVIPGADRMYRTGDLASWTKDGTLLCQGRMDQQVKLRGFRIELGEVESVALGVDGVESAVAVIQVIDARQQLVLFVRPRDVETARVREHLSGHFPAFMVPYYIVPMRVFPSTTTGKMDRNALTSSNHDHLVSVINSHPSVRHCVIIDRGDIPGVSPDPLRVAYVEPKNKKLTTNMLQALYLSRDIQRWYEAAGVWWEPNACVILPEGLPTQMAHFPMPTMTESVTDNQDKADETICKLAEIAGTAASIHVSLVSFVLDSISGMNFVRSVAARFNVGFAFQHLRTCDTLGELRDWIHSNKTVEKKPTLVSELAPLTGLRGLLMINVVVGNVTCIIGPLGLCSSFFWDRNWSVVFFYLISGLQLTVSFRASSRNAKAFIVAQLKALLPLYWLTCICSWWWLSQRSIPRLVVFLFGVQTWLYPAHYDFSPFWRDVNQSMGVLWWMSAYFAFVLVLPTLVRIFEQVLLQHTLKCLVSASFFCFLSSHAVVWLASYWQFDNPLDEIDLWLKRSTTLEYRKTMFWAWAGQHGAYWLPFMLLYLIVGMLIAYLYAKRSSIRSHNTVMQRSLFPSAEEWNALADVSFVASVMISFVHSTYSVKARASSDLQRQAVTDYVLLSPLQLVLLVTCLVSLPQGKSILRFVCLSRPIAFIGEVNWQLFLVHEPLVALLSRSFMGTLRGGDVAMNNISTGTRLVMLVGFVACALLLSWLVAELPVRIQHMYYLRLAG